MRVETDRVRGRPGDRGIVSAVADKRPRSSSPSPYSRSIKRTKSSLPSKSHGSKFYDAETTMRIK